MTLQKVIGYLAYAVAIIALATFIGLAFLSSPKKPTSQSKPPTVSKTNNPPQPQPPTIPSQSNGSQAQPPASSPNASQPTTPSNPNLTNSGPGDTLWLFLATAGVATA